METFFLGLLVIFAASLFVQWKQMREIVELRKLLTRYRPVESLMEHDGTNLPFPAQLLREVAHVSRDVGTASARIEELRDLVRYLHSYVWEVMDRRTLEEVDKGTPSDYWKTTFRMRHANAIWQTLWAREYDWNEDFRKHVIEPTERKREEDARSAGGAGASGSPPDTGSEASQ